MKIFYTPQVLLMARLINDETAFEQSIKDHPGLSFDDWESDDLGLIWEAALQNRREKGQHDLVSIFHVLPDEAETARRTLIELVTDEHRLWFTTFALKYQIERAFE